MEVQNNLIGVLTQSCTPSAYEIKNLIEILNAKRGSDIATVAAYCFNYGKIAGIQQERARRNKRNDEGVQQGGKSR